VDEKEGPARLGTRVVEKAKLVLVMVGLPARGKTYLARKISQYLAWLGYRTRIFNVGSYRRAQVGAKVGTAFFDPLNLEAAERRRVIAVTALEDLIRWLDEGGEVAVYDATNTTLERRNYVHDRLHVQRGLEVVFIETICDYEETIEENIRRTKLAGPDYAGVDPDVALADFRRRIDEYKKRHVPVAEADRSYIKLINLGEKVVANRLRGYLPSRILYFLLNLHTTRRDIYLTRHGESLFNLENRIGGDPPLSERGLDYARALARFFEGRTVRAYTSAKLRTTQTASFLRAEPYPLSALDEIDAGLCEGLTYDEIAKRFPDEAAARARDKLSYRYPQGESYVDVIRRLEPAIIEIERQTEDVLVIGHQAINRALYGYFLEKPSPEIPHLDMPLHTVVRLRPDGYGWAEDRFLLLTR
jgi:6-phosphofructo-2-kinase / fructose-2,6-biphosphatase 3